MMRLFDLPPELISSIFEAIACSRVLRRVMRLRLVNRLFKSLIEDVIIRLRLLEGGVGGIPGPAELGSLAVCGRVFIVEYLAHRAWMEKNPASLLGRIRHAAYAVSELATEGDDDDASGEMDEAVVFSRLRSLSRLAIGNALRRGHQRELLPARKPPEPTPERQATDISPERVQEDVCVAAVYLGCRSYVQGLIEQGGCQFCTCRGSLDVTSEVFGPAFKAAAVRGDVPMLRLLISSNPHIRPPETPSSHIWGVILKGAVHGGHKEAFDFALELGPFDPTRGDGRRLATTEYRRVRAAMESTPHPENYLRLAATFASGSSMFMPRFLRRRLTRNAAAGHLAMVRHLLDQGSHQLDNVDNTDQHPLPLVEACQGGSADIISLLLERGADPNYYSAIRTPLMLAARAGSLPIVKILLDAGARVDHGLPPPIVMAVFREDMDLFRLLRQRGASLKTPQTGGWAMAVARFHRLESMIDVLVHEGVETDTILQRCPNVNELRWDEYIFPSSLFAS